MVDIARFNLRGVLLNENARATLFVVFVANLENGKYDYDNFVLRDQYTNSDGNSPTRMLLIFSLSCCQC